MANIHMHSLGVWIEGYREKPQHLLGGLLGGKRLFT